MNATKSTPSVAVAGMGYWGKNIVRNFHALGALHTVCDSHPDVEATVKEQYPDTHYCTDFENLLTNQDIQAVALATPAVTHFSLAQQAMKAGKDVFVEKPLALTIVEGQELVDLAKAEGRILMVGHILQYHPAVLKLKSLIEEGDLGQVQYIYSNRLNMGKIRTEENILWSFAPHDISVIQGLLNEEPSDIQCQGSTYLSENVADVTMSQFIFPSGVRGHIFVSWLHPFKEQRLVVIGSKKMAVFDDTAADKLVLYPHQVQWKERIPVAIKAEGEAVELDTGEPLKSECAHFLDCVQSRETPVTDGEEGLRVLRTLNACQETLTGKKNAANLNNTTNFYAHPTACVDDPSTIGKGTKIWHYSHVLKGATIGSNCILGQNCNIAGGVTIGERVKIQNNVSVYTGTEIEDEVFLGPSCVLTNVTNPRSQINRHALYEKTVIRRGATIGANATIVCGIEIGRYAFVGAGSV